MVTRFLRLPAVVLASLLIVTSSSFASEDMASGRFFVGIGFDYGFTGQLTARGSVIPDGTGIAILENNVFAGGLLLGYRNDNYRFTVELDPIQAHRKNLTVTTTFPDPIGSTTMKQKIGYDQKRILASFDKLIHLSKEGLYANAGITGGMNSFSFGDSLNDISIVVLGAQAGINYDMRDWTFFGNLRYLTSTDHRRFSSVAFAPELIAPKVMYQNNLAITFGVSYNF